MQYFIILTVSIFGTVFYSNTSYAKKVSIGDLLPKYVSIQEALAKDDLPLAQKNAKALTSEIKKVKGNELQGLKKSLSLFQKTKTITEAREEFKKISLPFVNFIESHKESDFDLVYCPMAGAKWVQKHGEISNPYFGKKMLNCGEKSS
ncbi:MAG: DUF3347 domain-containing protein [Oligoflexia bacterium]|nr:DUF3347 domain-containing protein [Oligoflexia bacterium]